MVVKLGINVEIWNIVAHIEFKFYPGTSGTFSTASTFRMSGVFWVSSSQSLLVSRRAGHLDCFHCLDRTRRCPLDVSDPRRSGNQACNVGKNLGKGLVCGDEDI